MPSYEINDLLHLMARLRDPQGGCPWDIAQSYDSIVPCTLEEAYEVADAIERKDFDHLQEELGDLLFQVIFYAQLGKEDGHFKFNDVVDTLVKKLVRRHPHVFPDGDLYGSVAIPKLDEQEIKGRWEAIKELERQAKGKADELVSILDDVPKSLPAIQRAEKLQKRAATVGFDWPEASQVLDKIEEDKRIIMLLDEKAHMVLFHEKVVKALEAAEITGVRFVKVKDWNVGSAFD